MHSSQSWFFCTPKGVPDAHWLVGFGFILSLIGTPRICDKQVGGRTTGGTGFYILARESEGGERAHLQGGGWGFHP